MSRISMSVADSISRQEAAKKFDEKINEAEHSFKKLLTEKVKKKNPVPAIVTRMNEEEPGWLRHESNIPVYGIDGGTNYNYFDLTESVPVKIHGHLSVDVTEDLKGKHAKWKDLIKAKCEFKREVERVILGLGTPKRVVESIPELKKYFENELAKSTALVPVEQIKKVRSQLAKG
jgi:hypothetical protein